MLATVIRSSGKKIKHPRLNNERVEDGDWTYDFQVTGVKDISQLAKDFKSNIIIDHDGNLEIYDEYRE